MIHGLEGVRVVHRGYVRCLEVQQEAAYEHGGQAGRERPEALQCMYKCIESSEDVRICERGDVAARVDGGDELRVEREGQPRRRRARREGTNRNDAQREVENVETEQCARYSMSAGIHNDAEATHAKYITPESESRQQGTTARDE